ncbi:M48 family metalloprotease [Sphingomonas sp. CJ99]
MTRRIMLLFAAILLSLTGVDGSVRANVAADSAATESLRALAAADLRLATIAWRLRTANAPICDRISGESGLVVHARSSYADVDDAALQQAFGFQSEFAVLGVVAGSPGDRAGVRAGDSIVAIDRTPPPAANGIAGLAELMARLNGPADGKAPVLTLKRGGETVTVTPAIVPACTARIELRPAASINAATDGDVIQINTGLMNAEQDDARLAAILSHELAHVVLNHPDRLTAAGISRGLGSIFGRSKRLIRQTETEADQLAPWLLHNAGYPPLAAGAFWRSTGRPLSSLIGTGRYRHWSARARISDEQAALVAAGGPGFQRPPLLATRALPLN